MFIEEEEQNISMNETKTSMNENRNEVHFLLEEYDRLNLDYPEESNEYKYI